MASFRISIMVVGIVGASAIGGNMALAISCDPNYGEPNFFVYGLDFSPYKDGQNYLSWVTVEQIQERLAIINQEPHAQWIRTYGATKGLENIPEETRSFGHNVAMGTWVRHITGREAEIQNLIAKAQAGWVDIAVIGNEELYAYERGHPDALEPNDYINILNDVRERLDEANCPEIPIAAAEPFYTLFEVDGNGICSVKYPQLVDTIEIVFVNIYPFWQGVPIELAVADLAQRYQCALDAIEPGKPVVISETGWPSNGNDKDDAEPSLENLTRYLFDSSAWAADHNIPMFYFSAFDEKWKEIPPTPLGVASHWGIWDSTGRMKLMYETNPVLCETFDPPVHPFCTRKRETATPDPNIQPADPDSDGQFLRLLYDGYFSHFSAAAFNRVAQGEFPRIVAEFDFRLYGPDPGLDADGFGFMLIPTADNGTADCSTYSHSFFYAEEPDLPGTFAVGFDVYHPGDANDKISISWDNVYFPDSNQIDVPFDLDSGVFHHVRIDLRDSDSNTALVTIILTPDIYDPNHGEPVVIVHNLEIDDPNHPYKPYENRIEFVGRNGGQNLNVDIDNIEAYYEAEVCEQAPAGDANGDCKVDFFDLALLAENWLIDCYLVPYNPACVGE